MDLDVAIGLVKTEAIDARLHNEKFNSAHEGLAVILEEYEELENEVFKKREVRERIRLRTEAIHLAAMAVRFMVDLT